MTAGAPRPVRTITRLLVANRGEIARRVFRTASALGISTVAVYSEGDADAPFVMEADRAEPLVGRTAAETYLDIDAVLAAAARSGADAVHPGYGFLSERAGFARAVVEAGLIWVGPPAEAIAAMGDKLAAKELMATVGVPVLASRRVGPDGLLAGGSADLPLPVLVKAAAGGGGRGMRIVRRPGDLAPALVAAGREAAAAFGDPTVFVERYLEGARHVEIQVLADAQGHVVHLFERDCSVQRRHQKVIEEAPSPALDAALRGRMAAAAVAAIGAVGYLGVGTVEFVLEPDGAFWFLEVNTRLQVEHPVTESVTGVDLVRQQLLVASGLPIDLDPDRLAIDGHAVEARLYAEDPAAGFLPATGTVVGWAMASQPAVRVDSGIEVGTAVGVEFDPLLAKVVAHAPTRREAVLRLALALERAVIRGPVTNRDFLVAALRHPDFLAGAATTAFIEESGVALAREPAPGEVARAALAVALVGEWYRRSRSPGASMPSGWRNTPMPPQEVRLEVAGDTVAVRYRAGRDGSFAWSVDERTGVARVRSFRPRPGPAGVDDDPSGHLDLDLADGRVRLDVARAGDTWWVQGPEGDLRLVEVPRFARPAPAEVAGGLVAPMTGTVLAVEVEVGQEVQAGAVLIVVEAMKMEHRITAPVAGTVVELAVRAGSQVSGGDLLVVVGGGAT